MSSSMKTRRFVSLILSIGLLFSAYASAFGAAAATSTKADPPITRAEFMALVNQAYRWTEKADIHFKDLKASDQAYADVQIAVQAGYIQGYSDQTIRLGNRVSRQEAAAIVSRLQKLQGNAEAATAFADSVSFPEWSKEAIGAVARSLIMNGYEDNTFRPDRPITRAEATVILQSVIGVVYDQAGTYGPETGTETIAGNVMITAPGVKLRNMEITGDLRIAASVGDGDAHLDHVTVQGKTFINGGGENSIYIDYSTLFTGTVVERSSTDPVRIVLIGTTIPQVDVNSPLILQQGNGSGILNGVQTVNLNVPTKIFIRGGEIQYVGVGPNAGGSTVTLEDGAKVSEMNVESPVNVVGSGTIDKAILFTSPDGVLFEIQPGSTFEAPPTPTNVIATATGNQQALVSFANPEREFFITGYTVTSHPGNITADGLQSPIKITGLKPGEHYTFTVKSKNIAEMTSAASKESNVVSMNGSSPLSATTNEEGTIVSIRFNKPIKEPKNLLGQFFVREGNTSKIITEAALKDSTTIHLTLKNSVTVGQEVTVEYSSSFGMEEHYLAAADKWPVMSFKLPVKVLAPRPKFVNATTNTAGSVITLTFNKPMAEPKGMHAQFKVNVNGAPIFVSAAALNASTNKIDLTLGVPVKKEQRVTVAYVGSTVTSEDTGQLASFAPQNVTNTVTAEAPSFVRAATNTAGTVVTVTFDKPMADPAGMQSNFSVIVNGRPNFVKAAALNDTDTIDLTLATPMKAGETVTVAYVYTPGKVTAADKGVLASFAGQPVTNKVTAPPPAFVSATTNGAGTIVTVTFDKPMADPAGKQGQFAVNVNGAPNVVLAAVLNGANKIDLTLSTSVMYGQTVSVAYTEGTVTAADTGVLATFAPQPVTNAVPPPSPPPPPPIIAAPAFVSATTNAAGTVVTVTFNKPMADPTGKHSQFEVKVNGVTDAVYAAALNSDSTQIDLSLATPVSVGHPVTIAYTAGNVTSADTGVLATFAPRNVTNAVPVPAGAPAFVSATTNAAGTVVTVTFNKSMADPTGKHAEFTVNVNNMPNPIIAAALNGATNKIDLTLTTPVTIGQTVTVEYTAGTVAASDNAVLATFAARSVTNAVLLAPLFVSATTNAAGTIVTVTFNKAMANPPNVHRQFSVRAGGLDNPVTAAVLNSDTTKIDLMLTTPVQRGQSVYVAFLKYEEDTVTAADLGELGTFDWQTVTNAVP